MFDDADLAAVVEGLRTFGYYNAGQDCTAACRVYAGAKVYDKLVADLSSAVKTIKLGLPDEADVEVGPLISDRQRNRVASFVERALMTGHMEITAGGKARPGSGCFYEPTVVAGARQEDEIVKREVFGPVVSPRTRGVERPSSSPTVVFWINAGRTVATTLPSTARSPAAPGKPSNTRLRPSTSTSRCGPARLLNMNTKLGVALFAASEGNTDSTWSLRTSTRTWS